MRETGKLKGQPRPASRGPSNYGRYGAMTGEPFTAHLLRRARPRRLWCAGVRIKIAVGPRDRQQLGHPHEGEGLLPGLLSLRSQRTVGATGRSRVSRATGEATSTSPSRPSVCPSLQQRWLSTRFPAAARELWEQPVSKDASVESRWHGQDDPARRPSRRFWRRLCAPVCHCRPCNTPATGPTRSDVRR
jgi:hypothetical protein